MNDSRSDAFDLYHPLVQRWVWRQNWTELRDAQELAAAPIIRGDTDVLIAAATASGKTEAAFLPIGSRLVDAKGPGVKVLYVSPLRALINDQYERLEGFCEALDVPVWRWHKDVGDAHKGRLRKNPSGILLITPESLEAMFVLRGTSLGHMFGGLMYVVVDELHAFLGTERGRQVQSLLDRMELVVGRRVPRIALSATIGDLALTAECLRPGAGSGVLIVRGNDDGQEMRLQIRAYEDAAFRSESRDEQQGDTENEEEIKTEEGPESAETRIASHVYGVIRDGHHLVFANSRKDVEVYTDHLRRRAEKAGVTESFFPHHGSLSREIREEAERRLKDSSRPASAICTVTLELGIDVGAMESVVQIGPPASVASLRQRLGRSGRRGDAAILRVYVQEPRLRGDDELEKSLRAPLIQSVAVARLLIQGWYEPPVVGRLHLSTAIHQTLSIIAQHGGARPGSLFKILCQKGPFSELDKAIFADLLRNMAGADLITQMQDGVLLLGQKGERIVNHYDFYAVFTTPEEFRVIAGHRVLGALTIPGPLEEGDALLFAGRRWAVISLDIAHRAIYVAPAKGKRPPHFMSEGPSVHDRVRQEMRQVYLESERLAFLDPVAQDMLAEGRQNFVAAGADQASLIETGGETLILPWVGDRTLTTLRLALIHAGLEVRYGGPPGQSPISLYAKADLSRVRTALVDIRDHPPEPLGLAAGVKNKPPVNKYDWVLSEDLLTNEFAHRDLDVAAAARTAGFLLEPDPDVSSYLFR